MNDIVSKTNLGSEVTSKTDMATVVSKVENLPISKTDFHPISIAKNIPGADVIASLAGAFSACPVGDDWKEELRTQLEEGALA